MADIKKIATRVSYGNTLVELAQQGADNLVVFDADLAAATKTEIFRKEYPDRHFDCGIAEQNMVASPPVCPRWAMFLRVQLCHVRLRAAALRQSPQRPIASRST